MQDDAAGKAGLTGDPPRASSATVLPDRRELALVALERTRMPMVMCDAQQDDDPIVLANQAFLDLTGYAASEVIGRNCRFLQGPGTDAATIAAIRQALAADEGVEIELLNYRKDGSSFWNQLAISPVHSEDGILLYYFASQKDVSARRRAEESEQAERLLLMEVDHRAMNALTLVQSFVRLGRTDNLDAYAMSVQQRVDALARAHRLLAQNSWTTAELGDVVAMEIPPDRMAQVAADGPVQPLAAQIVQPITLALHELMTNAVAHGALAESGGMLDVSWSEDAGRTVLHWREHGAIPATRPVEGLGLGLVRGVVERQLGGRVSFDWTADGLVAELAFAPGGPKSAASPGSFRSAG